MTETHSISLLLCEKQEFLYVLFLEKKSLKIMSSAKAFLILNLIYSQHPRQHRANVS